jgi:uroporphyrinogen decarboxylase
MTRRETVIAALSHHETKPVPYHIELTRQSAARLAMETGDPDIEDKLGTYLHYTQYWGWPTEIAGEPNHFRDEFGAVWNRTVDKDIGAIDKPQITDIETSNYKFPEPDIKRLRADIESILAARGDRFAFMGFGFCMFERCWSLMGMENALISMLTSPDAMEDFFDRICDYFLRLVDVALEYDALDAVYFGDDWGQQHGLIMGPAHWRQFIKPRMAKLYARVKSKGKFVIQHSCGDNHEILGDLLEIGLDCYQTFQPEIYDIDDVQKRYGGKLGIWGGVSTQQVLPKFTPGELQKEIVRVINALRKDGGLIIAPTHALPYDVPAANILAMMEVFQNQDKFF